jgi:arylsulfatase A-like enzyme
MHTSATTARLRFGSALNIRDNTIFVFTRDNGSQIRTLSLAGKLRSPASGYYVSPTWKSCRCATPFLMPMARSRYLGEER